MGNADFRRAVLPKIWPSEFVEIEIEVGYPARPAKSLTVLLTYHDRQPKPLLRALDGQIGDNEAHPEQAQHALIDLPNTDDIADDDIVRSREKPPHDDEVSRRLVRTVFHECRSRVLPKAGASMVISSGQ